jgi:SET domain-containing protein
VKSLKVFLVNKKVRIFTYIVNNLTSHGIGDKKQMYKPLPNYVTIKSSEIEGLGLFATDNINANHNIGVSHVQDPRFEDGYCRTPLGGFFNHSETPNCKVVYDGPFIYLVTLKNIMAGEELTVTYTFYNPTK